MEVSIVLLGEKTETASFTHGGSTGSSFQIHQIGKVNFCSCFIPSRVCGGKRLKMIYDDSSQSQNWNFY